MSTRPCHAVVASLFLLGCGGSAPPPEPPHGAPLAPEPSSPAPVPLTEAEAAPPAAPPSDAPAAEAAEPAAPAPRRPLHDVLTAREIAFTIDYAASAPREAADRACSEQAGDDPGKRAECMTKARNDFHADVLRFKKDERGRVSWITYRRTGNTLTEVHTLPIEFADETADSIALLPKGKDVGKRLLFKNAKKVTFSVPDESTLVLEDPALGKLVYNAKIGLVGP